MHSSAAESRDSPWMGFVGHILAEEGLSSGDPASVLNACSRTMTELYELLVPIVGIGGYQAILGRCIVINCKEMIELGRKGLPQDMASWREALGEVLEKIPDASSREIASQMLVLSFLSSLSRILGLPLTLVLLRPRWPEPVFKHEAALRFTWTPSTHENAGED